MDNQNSSVPNVPYLEAMVHDLSDGVKNMSVTSENSVDYTEPLFGANAGLSPYYSQQANICTDNSKSPTFLSNSGKQSSYVRSTSYKSSTSSKIRHSSELGSCEVTVFDMRNANFSSGDIIYLDVQEQLVLHKIAQDYGVPENLLICMQSSVSGERNPCVVAIRENTENLTLFIRWDSGHAIGCKCVNVNRNATPKTLQLDLSKNPVYKDTYEKYFLYCNHQKLDEDRILTEQGVFLGNELLFREIKPVTLKCLYRSSSTADTIYYVNSLTTDTIDEVQLKVFNTMKKAPSNDEIRLLSSPEYIWLTSGNRLYTKREYIGSPARSDIHNISTGLSGLVDVIIHLQSSQGLPVNLLYSECNGTQYIEKIVISTSMSTAELRYKISTIMHCSPNALKIQINGKRIPEIDQISNFQYLKLNCTIAASIRQAITIKVKLEDDTHLVSVMKLDTVLTVKQKLSDVTGHQIKHIKLTFEKKELNDHYQIEKAHLKDESEIHAMYLPKRICVSIRKRGIDPVHLIIDDSQKIKMKLLKCAYTNKIKLKPKYDIIINYHCFGQSVRFEDRESLDSQGIEDGCKLYATESVNYYKMGILIKFFNCKKDGEIHIKSGAIIKGKLMTGMGNSSMSDDSSLEFDSQETQREIAGIRLAYPEEMATFSSNSGGSCGDTKDLSKALVKLKISTPGGYQRSEIYTESPSWFPISSPFQAHNTMTSAFEHHSYNYMSHSITVPNLGEPPGVVSDRDLGKLVKELPANVWQSFMRELIPDAEVTKQIESHKGNVEEQMFQCLKKWKQIKGKKATKKVLQEALRSQELNLIAAKLFPTEVQSD